MLQPLYVPPPGTPIPALAPLALQEMLILVKSLLSPWVTIPAAFTFLGLLFFFFFFELNAVF